jgi:hypothetical protein
MPLYAFEAKRHTVRAKRLLNVVDTVRAGKTHNWPQLVVHGVNQSFVRVGTIHSQRIVP